MFDLLKDITGQRFGLLTVIQRSEKRSVGGNAYWLCNCDCGNVSEVRGSHLRSGLVISCGCRRGIRHGHTVKGEWSPTYTTWAGMIARCYNPNATSYPRYGALGIRVCSRWMTFKNFLEDMGARPEGKTLDRINHTKSYGPDNCQWATILEQNQNQKTNVYYSFQGKTRCLAEWSRELRISQTTLWNRINKLGWSVDRAFSTPKRRKHVLLSKHAK